MPLRATLRSVAGIVGQVTSFALFAAPLITMWQIYKRKDVEGFSPNPYLAGIINCLMWVFYGLPFITSDNILVLIINSIGLALELFYVAMFLYYSSKRKESRKYIYIGFPAIMVFFVVFAAVILGRCHTMAERKLYAGIGSVCFSIALYAMPLDILRRVIVTRSVEYLPLYLCLAGLIIGVVWAFYAYIYDYDVWILVPNSVGACFGLIQVFIYFITPYLPPPKQKAHGQQVELSSVKEASLV